MRKKLVLLTCLLCLIFSNVVFADEINKVDISSEKETLAIQEAQLGQMRTLSSLNPDYDNVQSAFLTWNLATGNTYLDPGQSTNGLRLNITVNQSDITKSNNVTFTYYGQYRTLNGSYYTIQGSYDDIIIDGNYITIVNPHNTTANGYDLIIALYFDSTFTNNTNERINLNISGNICPLSSGTELIDIFKSYFTVNQVVVILSAAVGACITLVFMWWGVRKMANGIMSAFRKGKLRI